MEIEGEVMLEKEIKKFINKRPKVKGAYGYGSGVFKQSGYTSKDKPQIDMIFVVDDLKKWHLENIKLNPKDYSFTAKLYFKRTTISQLKGNTGIVYLSNIKENDSIYKYGTIEERDLERYLDTWESFYLPGRFQKTLLPIVESKIIEKMNKKNRENVLYTALLTLPEDKNKLIDVYTQICGLSYLGDTRMKFAENPRKVLNIVEGSFNTFKDIYGTGNEYFKTNKNQEITVNHDKLMQDIKKLPKNVLEYLGEDVDKQNKNFIKEKILAYFTEINKNESSKQTIKGLYSNGIIRSTKYAMQKVLKKIKK